jgi:hypothetical protein
MNHSFLRTLRAVVGALALLSVGAMATPLSYQVAVDTSDLNGALGYLDVQFNPAVGTAPAAQAVVSAFATDGTLTGAPTLDGDAVGNLAAGATLGNSAPFNALLQGITFGNVFSFVLTLDGDFLTLPSLDATGFSLGLLDTVFNPLASASASGRILDFQLVNGGASFTDQGTPVGQNPRITVTDGPTPAPLPAGLWLLAAGALAFARMKR